MKKYLFGIVLGIFYSHTVQSQQVQFVKSFGGINSTINTSSMTIDSIGNHYLAGYFTGEVDFDPGNAIYNLTSVGLKDVFITKLDKEGRLVWAKRFGGPGNDTAKFIAMDSYQNIYVAGYTKENGYIEGDTFKIKKNQNCFLLKLKHDGRYVWVKNIVQSDSCAQLNSITYVNNHLFLTGSFFKKDSINFIGGNDSNLSGGLDWFGTVNGISNIKGAYVVKMDTNGTGKLINFLYYFGYNAHPYDMTGECSVLDKTSKLYRAGIFKNSIYFNPGSDPNPANSKGKSDVFITKYDSSQGFKWVKHLGGLGEDRISSIKLDSYGNLFSLGSFEGALNFDEGKSNFTLTSSGLSDIFVMKLDSGGNFIWAKQFGGNKYDLPTDMFLDENGKLFIGGFFSEAIPFISLNKTLTTSGSNAGFVLKMDTSGTVEWAKGIDGSGSSTISSVKVHKQGTISFIGDYSGNNEFGLSSGVSWLFSAVGNWDGFLEKISQPTVVTNQSENSFNGIRIFPNPTSDYILVTNDLNIGMIKIVDVTGKEFFSTICDKNELRIDVKSFPKGIHTLKTVSEGNTLVSKFLVE